MRFNHANFQRGRAAENFFGACGVLHAGQLHHNTVRALLLDNRLGHTQFVHAIAQRGNVLLEREFLRARDGLQLEFGNNLEFRAILLRFQFQIGKRLFNLGQPLRLRIFVAESHNHVIPVTGDAGILNTLVAQRTAYIAYRGVDFLVERGLHVHLQQKMHAAAQIQTQIHRQRADGSQPLRAA